jgi:predicted transport protein
MQGHTLELFNHLRKQLLDLDPAVREEPKKLYIAYKTTTNFVDVIPLRNKLRLTLNMPFAEINDPKGLCRDMTNIGRWGNGDVEVNFEAVEQLDDIIFLVKQAFDQQDDDL